MSYQALYRVWRPRVLSDVVGQEHITTTLKNALVQQKLSHAYLFTGPRGTGKTSAAKIISKAINCEHAPVEEPCNQCTSCRGISDGSIVDVMEIDAASNNGVDEIRDIRDKVKFAPSAVKYKVYIIDEVHMLSTGAFNALLKTLEEPPRHVIFILATTEPHKIPLTIISRCQRFDFKRISPDSMINRMKEIVQAGDIAVEEDALAMIARASEGGMRDALSLLDQAISYSESAVTLQDVLSIIGAVSQQLLFDIAQALKEQDVAKALTSIDAVVKEGKDPNRFIEDMIYFYRDLLLYRTAPSLKDSMERVTADETFISLSKELPSEWIYKVMDLLNHFQQEMKWSNHPKVFLELFAVRACHESKPAETGGADSDTVKQLVSKVNELEKTIKQLQASPGGGAGNGVQQADAQPQKKPVPRSRAASAGKSRSQMGRVREMLSGASKAELQSLTSKWGQISEQVKGKSVPASAWLSDCKPVASSGDKVVLAFKNEMHRDMIDTKFRSIVEDVLSSVTGKQITVLTILTIHWEETKDTFVKEQRGDEGEEEEDPVVGEAIKLMGEDLVEVKE
ncbi:MULTISPECIES: DNA polymerase III subunit gamma/tau [Alteribacter]|uniref:DNA-directed DNA polymerase n=1 Tax=Alteribacter keqinensis TaxID=2483800 RepID=A0A3M7TLS9_9BACI|nr:MULTISPECIES: DNA polymerase III subunit gamma/tau [Alteribacter]MBM7098024.1 DNA polymerase III subunit gamma/tau [Alteribacter salitolerans]RNA65940.1 DNA polymerase III subunit gamma/tau [Alteribacter keqinensis]